MAENTTKNTKKRLKDPWKKGQTGNPNGRPLGQRNYATIYKEALIKLATMNGMEPEAMETDILLKGLASARKGDYRFWKDIHDRIHGTATQKTDITSKGEKLNFVIAETIAVKNDLIQKTE
jgi:hypothetical protein